MLTAGVKSWLALPQAKASGHAAFISVRGPWRNLRPHSLSCNPRAVRPFLFGFFWGGGPCCKPSLLPG